MQRITIWLLICLPVFAATAEECCEHDHDHEKTAPYLTVHVDSRVHADQIYSADDPLKDTFTLKTHTHVNLDFVPHDDWAIHAMIKAEQAHDHHNPAAPPPDANNSYFENHQIFIEELKLVYSPGAWELFAGKFNPVDGLDQHAVPGFYGYEIIEEHSIHGRIGAGATYTFDTGRFGSHRVEASGFFRDTTFLNQSLLTASGQPDNRQDGGVANTHDFSSWAVSLSGDVFYGMIGDTIHEIDYVLAYAVQDVGFGAAADHENEERAAVALVHNAALSEDLVWRNIGQMKHFDNSHTHQGETLLISTFGSGFYYEGWELGGSYSFMESNADPDGYHAQASLGYVWDCGFGIYGGWKFVEEDDEQQGSLGLMLSYHGHFL